MSSSSHRKYDHKIELNEEALTRAPLYHMSKKELLLIKSYLKEHLEKDFIVVSSVSFVSFILFAKKPGEELRFCVDYRRFNEITKKNSYLISLITDLMTRLSKTKFLTKIDICHAFNRIRMTIEKNENLTTFRIRFKVYKYRVLLFELINESIIFQNFINNIFMKYLDDFVVVYLDDILIYSQDLKKHRSHVKKMLQKLKKMSIQIDIDKCEFHVAETKFLRVIVDRSEVRMNSKKIVVIQN